MEKFRGAIGDEISWSAQVMAGRAKHVQSVAIFPPRFQLCWRHVALASLISLTVGIYGGRIYDDWREQVWFAMHVADEGITEVCAQIHRGWNI